MTPQDAFFIVASCLGAATIVSGLATLAGDRGVAIATRVRSTAISTRTQTARTQANTDALRTDAKHKYPERQHPRTIVVGTDGSASSMRAVDRAAEIAGADAKLIIASAYLPQHEDRPADILKEESYKVSGTAPIWAILQDARQRAQKAGATTVEQRPIVGAPVEALVDLVEQENADLLVVGNGLSMIAGRLLGSVPANVSHRAKFDLLIVHTS
jgi:nucleotide-binding universal stress UspA family protein